MLTEKRVQLVSQDPLVAMETAENKDPRVLLDPLVFKDASDHKDLP